MIATRALGVHTRLLARTFGRTDSAVGSQLLFKPARFAAAAVVPKSSALVSVRTAASTTTAGKTTSYNQDEALELLNKQRSLRPTSPHLTIYQPQLTWYASIFNRMTGVGLSALLYVWALGYLASPYIGLDTVLSSSYLVEYISHLPFWLKTTLKAPLAVAATFHTWNGFRHLAWDAGYFLSLKGCYTSGYAVIGATVLSTVGLLMI
ncbi:cytochrome b subunit of succinate dehydrogenase, Sdh3p [Tilletia horrida]|uniref:Cytochrome b subunit of succinate dehydrogenase, Sdh3p n=1 Tax=Tilletia horrida TaxID=155126 RepID=A0AAN6JPN6_9BASI|nr:cytochrome b subunit of succinate dehydrogenase, Sdh3p [Tilletia horrida]KAK0551027.1 cytochrome b subunit of succinate dehydrogenase, Sdh3p [Tilletia horrida]KAK0570143.1 cytochrome b subunit of succinate dehydrogenase, Sdh3p [Tilletia horrida]